MLPTDVKCCVLAETAEDCYILLKNTNLALFYFLSFTYFRETWKKASSTQHKKLRSLVVMLKHSTRGSCVYKCRVYLQFFMDELARPTG